MKIKKALLLLCLIQTADLSNASEIKGLAGTWCLTGTSLEQYGEIIPEKSEYLFQHDEKFNYSMRITNKWVKIEDLENEVTEKPLGAYKVIEMTNNTMVMLYGSYMHFVKGSCK